jgi:hypothetical protein
MASDSESPAPSSETSGSLRKILKSDSFVEKALILAGTVVLSGLLVPLIIMHVNSVRVAREGLSHAQAKLFDDVSETILTSETLLLDISWFGTEHAKNAEMQKKAFERYSERSVDLIAKWRAQSSRAMALASPQVSKKLKAFQLRFFQEQDTPMNRQWIKCGTDCDWKQLHMKNELMLAEGNELVVELARDLGLVKE